MPFVKCVARSSRLLWPVRGHRNKILAMISLPSCLIRCQLKSRDATNGAYFVPSCRTIHVTSDTRSARLLISHTSFPTPSPSMLALCSGSSNREFKREAGEQLPFGR